jgi:hypothetical protein
MVKGDSMHGFLHKIRIQLEDHGRIYLLYAVAGESGIAIAEITLPTATP